MADNENMSTVEYIQDSLPDWYDKYSDNSVIKAIICAIADRIDECNNAIDRVNNCIGIDTTGDQDLYYVWGSLLSMPKKQGISCELYRNELKMAIPSLVGGTENAIKYSIAVAIGVEKDKQLRTDYISIYDAWDYDDGTEFDISPGNFICVVDISVGSEAVDVEQRIIDAVNKAKASGTNYTIVYKSAKILDYYNMDRFSYDSLSETDYDRLGMEE